MFIVSLTPNRQRLDKLGKPMLLIESLSNMTISLKIKVLKIQSCSLN